LRATVHLPAIAFLIAISSVGAQHRNAQKLARVEGPVSLIPHAAVIAVDVPAFPRVGAGPGVTPRVAAAINASLTHAEAHVRSQALDCDAVGRKMYHDARAWTRKVDVTMRGPLFLAYLATDDYSCGAYPEFGMQSPLVYDLKTGEQVDWANFLPAGADPANWAALQAIAKQRATAECKAVFEDGEPVPFTLSLNARTGTLDAKPDNLPCVVQACAETVALDANTLRRLGVATSLINSLNAAHTLQHPPNVAIPTRTEPQQN
jgi:hypothetical protein